jgi:hypothetical protein
MADGHVVSLGRPCQTAVLAVSEAWMRRRGQMDSKRAGEAVRPANARAGIGGVPGSDMRFVPGIRLTDPMKQGIGAVTRKVQRLFGVTNHHCIDVDVWRHLTPQELSARHISSGDVDKIDEKYDCNRPPGLSI